tara:strand:+ start:164 stop:484 length:321 start_codon:yes stop_codon:yes gene_type:complete
MERGLHHITATGDTRTTLIPINGYGGSIKSIRITNCSAAVVSVDLYLESSAAADAGRSHILLQDFPAKTSLLLDEEVGFDNAVLSLAIRTTGSGLTAALPLSIIIK